MAASRIFQKLKQDLVSSPTDSSEDEKPAQAARYIERERLKYEKNLIKLENQVRNHIKCEQQLKLHIEQTQGITKDLQDELQQ